MKFPARQWKKHRKKLEVFKRFLCVHSYIRKCMCVTSFCWTCSDNSNYPLLIKYVNTARKKTRKFEGIEKNVQGDRTYWICLLLFSLSSSILYLFPVMILSRNSKFTLPFLFPFFINALYWAYTFFPFLPRWIVLEK